MKSEWSGLPIAINGPFDVDEFRSAEFLTNEEAMDQSAEIPLQETKAWLRRLSALRFHSSRTWQRRKWPEHTGSSGNVCIR